jgi:UDP-2-acetamido-3-amino-2,3-dideoxy-glucuronate N-acetyltransferase
MIAILDFMLNIHPTAEVHPTAIVPASSKVWNFSQVREGVSIGENCTIGRNVYIGPGVTIGDNCKIQNNALIYEPAVIEDGVFIGPGVVLTNDKHPRAINRDGTIKSAMDWEAVGVTIRRGASVGANSVCVAPVELGEWSAVGANSVVSKAVLANEIVTGNPAKSRGYSKY